MGTAILFKKYKVLLGLKVITPSYCYCTKTKPLI